MIGYSDGSVLLPKYFSASSSQAECSAPHPVCILSTQPLGISSGTYMPNWNQILAQSLFDNVGGDYNTELQGARSGFLQISNNQLSI